MRSWHSASAACMSRAAGGYTHVMAGEPKKRRDAAGKHAQESPLKAISGFVHDSDFQRLLNDRVRLGILSCLSVAKRLTFTELKSLLSTSDGNLSTHARKLEDAGLIVCHKSFDGRTPRTEFSISPLGKRSLKRYLKHMEALIRATSE